MLQNARVTAFTVSELLRENQLGGKVTPPQPSSPPPVLGLSSLISFSYFLCFILFTCDGLHDGKIPCLRKRLERLDDRSLSCTLLLVKLGLFSGVLGVT